MKCPYCGNLDSRVIDSRISRDKNAIKRRRECDSCKKRFTTYEKVEEMELMVVKKDGRRELFSRNKIIDGIKKACQKRPISIQQIEEFVDNIETFFQEKGRKEIPSKEIGEMVISKLKEWDEVAYVRFASVYKQFKDIQEFLEELEDILKAKQGNAQTKQ